MDVGAKTMSRLLGEMKKWNLKSLRLLLVTQLFLLNLQAVVDYI